MSLACNSLGQGFAWLEFDDLLGGDFEGRASGWVSSFSGRTFGDFEGTKANQLHRLVLDQRLFAPIES